MCSPSNIFRASCYAKKFKKEMNIYERYFEDPYVGGVDPLTDRCPIAFEEKGGQNYYGGSCRVGGISNIGKLEKICPECACFMSTLDVSDDKVVEGVETSGRISNDAKRKLRNLSKRLRFKQNENSVKNVNNNINKSSLTNYKTVSSNSNKIKSVVHVVEKNIINKQNNSTETAEEIINTNILIKPTNNLIKNNIQTNLQLKNNDVELKRVKTEYGYVFDADPQLTADDPLASCFQHKCEGAELFVIIDGKSIRCPSDEKITIEGYKGSIICPKNEILCHVKFQCKFGCTEKYDNNVEFVNFRAVGTTGSKK
jgi:hypothetical protein